VLGPQGRMFAKAFKRVAMGTRGGSGHDVIHLQVQEC